MYVTHKITLNCPDNVPNMTYSRFFLKSGTGLKNSFNTVTYFNDSFYKCLEFLPLYTLLSVSCVIFKYQYESY